MFEFAPYVFRNPTSGVTVTITPEGFMALDAKGVKVGEGVGEIGPEMLAFMLVDLYVNGWEEVNVTN